MIALSKAPKRVRCPKTAKTQRSRKVPADRENNAKRAAPPRSRKTATRALDSKPPQSEARPRATRVTVANEEEALRYFALIDERLAEAWRRDVVVHTGPITIYIVQGTFFDATHYAYVDSRLLWYLRHDPSDPLGARWDGYLRSERDAPRGSVVVFVGNNIVAKKATPQVASKPPEARLKDVNE